MRASDFGDFGHDGCELPSGRWGNLLTRQNREKSTPGFRMYCTVFYTMPVSYEESPDMPSTPANFAPLRTCLHDAYYREMGLSQYN